MGEMNGCYEGQGDASILHTPCPRDYSGSHHRFASSFDGSTSCRTASPSHGSGRSTQGATTSSGYWSSAHARHASGSTTCLAFPPERPGATAAAAAAAACLLRSPGFRTAGGSRGGLAAGRLAGGGRDHLGRGFAGLVLHVERCPVAAAG